MRITNSWSQAFVGLVAQCRLLLSLVSWSVRVHTLSSYLRNNIEAMQGLYINGDNLITYANVIATAVKDVYEATEQVIKDFKNFAEYIEEWLKDIWEKQDFIQDLATNNLDINAQQQWLLTT